MTIHEAKRVVETKGFKIREAKTKEQCRKVQEYMLGFFDSYEDLISEIQHYYNDYEPGRPYMGRKAMVEQCFYADVDDLKDFFHDLYSDQHYTPEQQAKFDHRYEIPSGRAQIEQQYNGLLQMELDNLFHNPEGGGKNYIAPSGARARKTLHDVKESRVREGDLDVGRGTPEGRCLSSKEVEEFALNLKKHMKYLARTGDGPGTFKFKQAKALLKTLENQQFI
jgi:hypothetical protein